MQQHVMKCCQEHTKPASADTTPNRKKATLANHKPDITPQSDIKQSAH